LDNNYSTWNVPDPDGAGPCTAATDQMNITINNATVASAGPDQTLVVLHQLLLLLMQLLVVTGPVVRFICSDRNTANATYTPAVGEIGTTLHYMECS
jgi:hypothetical protein